MFKGMEVHFTPETEKKLNDLAAQSGRGTDDLLEDAVAAYFAEKLEFRQTLDSRYDDLESGRVKPIDGEEAFKNLMLKPKRSATALNERIHASPRSL